MKPCTAYTKSSKIGDTSSIEMKKCYAYNQSTHSGNSSEIQAKQCSTHIKTNEVEGTPAIEMKLCSAYSSAKKVRDLPAVPTVEYEPADYEVCDEIYEGILKTFDPGRRTYKFLCMFHIITINS